MCETKVHAGGARRSRRFDVRRVWCGRTVRDVGRVNEELRRRTRVAAIFPNPESCLRLVSAILMEISEAWETSKAYLNPKLLK